MEDLIISTVAGVAIIMILAVLYGFMNSKRRNK